MTSSLQRWIRIAEQEVERTRGRLPPSLRDRAAEIPVTCVPRPTRAMQRDGVDPELLGLFVGEALPMTEAPGGDLPAQILLFIENLADYSDCDEDIFQEEVRTTYLHELGHYLGLDEDELVERDLE
ncbi:MAG TPA: metallopeptidase family protein [Kiritimatiellia bacterium]|nr:metallopeptidase family protein [Kiritimatiellia bacterium]HRZ11341.1 metallopeptidase family protein [Kiritimatiellia bacterium]HSA17108.1 metallopeptidase family protein [Kiritimatiellia bacterium]